MTRRDELRAIIKHHQKCIRVYNPFRRTEAGKDRLHWSISVIRKCQGELKTTPSWELDREIT